MSNIKNLLEAYQEELEKRRRTEPKTETTEHRVNVSAFNQEKIIQNFSLLKSEFRDVIDYKENQF